MGETNPGEDARGREKKRQQPKGDGKDGRNSKRQNKGSLDSEQGKMDAAASSHRQSASGHHQLPGLGGEKVSPALMAAINQSLREVVMALCYNYVVNYGRLRSAVGREYAAPCSSPNTKRGPHSAVVPRMSSTKAPPI